MTTTTMRPAVGDDSIVDVNTADRLELARLPGVGPGAAALIVHERETRGPYVSVWDLTRVEGFDWWRIGQFADSARA